MPPKKGKKGKKKEAVATEPNHDPGWERALARGKWDRPIEALPGVHQWPTWGALRERIIMAMKEITVTLGPSLKDGFLGELVKLSPPELTSLDGRGSSSLHRLILSPATACPKLSMLDLSGCDNLGYVLIQSTSLTVVRLARNPGLKKAMLQCRNATDVRLEGCTGLETLLLWSDELTSLDLSTCASLSKCELHCPKLLPSGRIMPENGLFVPPEVPLPRARPISAILREQNAEAGRVAADRSRADKSIYDVHFAVPAVVKLYTTGVAGGWPAARAVSAPPSCAAAESIAAPRSPVGAF